MQRRNGLPPLPMGLDQSLLGNEGRRSLSVKRASVSAEPAAAPRGSAAGAPDGAEPGRKASATSGAEAARKASGSLRNLRTSIENVPQTLPPTMEGLHGSFGSFGGGCDSFGLGRSLFMQGQPSADGTGSFKADTRVSSKEVESRTASKEGARTSGKGESRRSSQEDSSSGLSDSSRDSSDESGSKKRSTAKENASGDAAEDMGTTWRSVIARLETPIMQDRRLLAEVSESMVSQLSSTFACMHQALSRERTRHSSGVSLMIRKVDKDLRETFQSVRDTFKVLTEQLVLLAKESETGRRQVKSIQAAYAKVKYAAEAQSQYVHELEAVIDGQSRTGISQKLKKLSAEATLAQHTLATLKQDFQQQQQALLEENRKLKKELKRMDDSSRGITMPGSVDPPKLPEMVASWTRREIRDSPGACGSTPCRQVSQRSTGSPGLRTMSSCSSRCTPMPMGDVVGGMLAHSDASRSVSRCKGVRPASQEARRAAHTPTSARGEHGSEVSDLKRRLRVAEEKCEKQRKIVAFASTALLLLRDIFSELRLHRHIQAAEEVNGEPDNNVLLEGSASKPHEVLDRLVKLFYGAIPRLGNFSELLAALGEEAAGRDAEFSPVLEDGGEFTSITLQPESDMADATTPRSSTRPSGMAFLQTSVETSPR